VDDFFVFTNCKTEKDRLVAALKENFDVKFLGPIRHC
jgi:hypothetical protein